jgi:hypothetical protein
MRKQPKPRKPKHGNIRELIEEVRMLDKAIIGMIARLDALLAARPRGPFAQSKYMSGTWIRRDGDHFVINPTAAEVKAARDADRPPGDLRPPNLR